MKCTLLTESKNPKLETHKRRFLEPLGIVVLLR
jgi:hypothetical protein